MVEWPEMQHPQSDFFDQLRASGGRWEELPSGGQLANPGGKPLTETQLAGIIDSSLKSPTRSLDEIEKQLSKGRSEG